MKLIPMEPMMTVSVFVTSRGEYARGKTQFSSGEPQVQILPKHFNGEKDAVEIIVKSIHWIGSGSRGGLTKTYNDSGTVRLDKEALIKCLKESINHNVISMSEIFDENIEALLEAALEIEKTRSLVK